ncbi:MBL fold metallo-hydrolase [Alkalihalobacillus sp. BA299]|uniref:MBL fold metallo-hydrolase n=1 Tax=Alkalihalobacillus sp. BA299 TaxID=2815938 RepID=UPI001ADB64CD|nr:MBL fold metallo-hydrolase [Alkalihalobacillus sp. BA299]
MKLTFLGGAGEYGRSCFLLELENKKILIDCGVMKNGATRAEQYPLLTSDLASDISAVFLTHAHKDHSAALPYLSHLGFKGNVYATPSTITQTKYYLGVWRKTQLKHNGTCPYTIEDERNLAFKVIDERLALRWIETEIPGLTYQFGKSGHVVGAIWYFFQFKGEKIFFSGDFSLESYLLEYDQPKVVGGVDVAVMDGAYGVENVHQNEYSQKLIHAVNQSIDQDTSVILPLPPFGRAQDMFLILEKVMKRDQISVIVDQPILHAAKEYLLAKSWLKKEIYLRYKQVIEWLEGRALAQDKCRLFIAFFSESKLLADDWWLEREEPIQIIYTGPKNIKLVDKVNESRKPSIMISTTRYKVHPAVYEIEHVIEAIRPNKIWLTHSNLASSQPLADLLHKSTGRNVSVPKLTTSLKV